MQQIIKRQPDTQEGCAHHGWPAQGKRVRLKEIKVRSPDQRIIS